MGVSEGRSIRGRGRGESGKGEMFVLGRVNLGCEGVGGAGAKDGNLADGGQQRRDPVLTDSPRVLL